VSVAVTLKSKVSWLLIPECTNLANDCIINVLLHVIFVRLAQAASSLSLVWSVQYSKRFAGALLTSHPLLGRVSSSHYGNKKLNSSHVNFATCFPACLSSCNKYRAHEWIFFGIKFCSVLLQFFFNM